MHPRVRQRPSYRGARVPAAKPSARSWTRAPPPGHYDRSVPECLFCGIAAGEIPATVVLDGKRDHRLPGRQPAGATHVLVIPRDHYPNVAALAERR